MRANLVYVVAALFALMFLGLLALGVYMFSHPAEAVEFLNTYGSLLFALIMLAVGIGIGASYYWFKAIRVYIVDHLSGGGQLIGIATEDPIEVNMRQVLSPELPDAGVTMIPASTLLGVGRPVLLPVHKERGVGWGEFANIYGRQIRFINFYGRFVTLDEFLAAVYGLNVSDDNPNDKAVLRSYLQKIDRRVAARYLYFDPYAKPQFLRRALEESSTVAEGAKEAESMRLMRRWYESIIAKLQQTILALGREVKEFHEQVSRSVYRQTRAVMQSMANPIKLMAEVAGVPPDKAWRFAVAELVESAPQHPEIAAKLQEDIARSAESLGFVVVPKKLLDELRERAERAVPLPGGAPVEAEYRVKQEVREAEGK